ncbi:hypothetical protein BCV70DRAFT_33955 [Testicularia cyperi]|uniref:Uncharacterized protein n=1 Tax=Testicularia cyperi TaxID=1882483 RepID=A0A317XJW1_9BASI|nr:hypothetical protein BCV70DRAFT_33955 [Testicularia cyperi]
MACILAFLMTVSLVPPHFHRSSFALVLRCASAMSRIFRVSWSEGLRSNPLRCAFSRGQRSDEAAVLDPRLCLHTGVSAFI